jgi:deoxyhypusine synthase
MANVRDFKVERDETVSSLVKKLGTTGFQGSHIEEAANVLRRMRESDATVFLAFTANMMASGLRGVLTQMIDEGLVDGVITTGGSIDHDIIKSYKPYGLGDFNADDVKLHKRGINRIGNIMVPTRHYIFLDKWMQKVYARMHREKRVFAPSELNEYMGSILPKDSFLSTCHRHKVPVFCPGMIDAAVGMHLYFFRQKHRDLIMDPAGDLHKLADLVFAAKHTGGIILGGGISKHHLIGANLMRGGLDYALYVTTAQEYDGSLSGAHPKEAKSWGKIREKGVTATVFAEASLALPLILAGAY